MVVGTGVAGLTAAVEAARLGVRVVVVTKDAADAGLDAVGAGRGRGRRRGRAGRQRGGARRRHAHRGRGPVRRGGHGGDPARRARPRWPGCAPVARCSTSDGDRLARTREGGHSAFRVIHAGGDATGAEIERALVRAAAGLPLLTGHVAVDVLRDARGRVAGLAVLDDAGQPGVLHAQAVLLATGGYGQLYASTTNPATATGDGVALALRAGAAAADLEFVQFHPTVLYTGPTPRQPPAGDRGGARRGRGADRPGGPPVPARRAPAGRPRAARRRRRRDHPADGRDRHRLRLPRRPRARRVRPRASRRCTRPAGPRGSTRCASRSR